MRSRALVMASILALVSPTPVQAAEDLSSFGELVETTGPAPVAAQTKGPANRVWPAHVCAEIQRVEEVEPPPN